MKFANIIILALLGCVILASCNNKKETNISEQVISIRCNDVKLDSDIRYIFYGFTTDGRTVKMKDLPFQLNIMNGMDQGVGPLFFTVRFHTRVPVKISRYYKIVDDYIEQDSIDSSHVYILSLYYKVFCPFEKIPFPITEISIGEEAECIPLIIAYGDSPELRNEIKCGYLIYPLTRENKRYEADYFEQIFLGDVWNFIDWEYPEQHALAFDSVLVPRMINYKKFEPENFTVKHLNELSSR